MINGDLGLKEISEYIDNIILNFWHNLATGDENKVSSILYKWVKIQHDQITGPPDDQSIVQQAVQGNDGLLWIKRIKVVLDQINMSDSFHNIADINKSWFKNNIKVKLVDFYCQKWSNLVSNNSV